jgi:glycine cleavage system aminomethyltransferase T
MGYSCKRRRWRSNSTTAVDVSHARDRGAHMVAFADYEMQVQFAPGVLKDHEYTRAAAGLSHTSQACGEGVIRLGG